MQVFVTGATGFIGMAVVKELVAAGHQVLGLSRTEAKAAALAAAGAKVHHGSVENTDDLKAAAARCDAVIHLAFNHDFSRFQQNCEDDRRVVAALGSVLAGSDRPLVVTSGTAIADTAPGRPAQEDDPAVKADVFPRAASEEAVALLVERGVNASAMRLPQVHDTVRQGFVTSVVESYRRNGACAYVGDGANRWPAAHVSDVARLYRLAVEKQRRGARYHAVGEEGVAMRAIAETVGQRLGLPVRSIAPAEAESFFGWIGRLAAHDMPAASAQTRAQLGWQPTGPGMLADLANLQMTGA